MNMNRSALFVGIAMALAVTMPAAALDVPIASPEPTKSVLVKGERDVIEAILADERFQVKYDWPNFGLAAGTMGLSMYLEYSVRSDVLVEDDLIRTIECHRASHPCDGGGGGGTTPRISDQIPYGVEQIYNSNTITATSGGAGKRLGHFDTGILSSHLDLVNRIVACQSTASSDCSDKNGHGTHTAGTAAADAGSDDLGIWGVASEASIHTIKVCSNGGLCAASDTIEAIEICIAAGCDVITYSIGGDSPSESERVAIAEFVNGGGMFVAASGNDGSGTCSIDYPGAFKEVVSVGAIDSSKSIASFSSRGCSADSNSFDEDGEIDFVAGGVSVISTYKDGGYASMSGTSMATPHVAGLALKKGNTNSALLNGVEDLGASGVDIAYGNGLPHT